MIALASSSFATTNNRKTFLIKIKTVLSIISWQSQNNELLIWKEDLTNRTDGFTIKDWLVFFLNLLQEKEQKKEFTFSLGNVKYID